MKFLYVATASEIHPAAIRSVSDCVTAHFGAPVREIALPAIDFAFDSARRQYRSTDVLEMLVRLCPADALKILAVTEKDLFIPVLTFVFGQAQLGGRVAVVSLARLRQEFYGLPANPDVFYARVRKEALHETGHACGLVHCAGHCAMALSTNVQQIDRKPAAFCAACAARLGRVAGIRPAAFPKEEPS